MTVAKSLSCFRLAEPSCFRIDAITGALLVIAPMQSRVVAVHLQQSTGKNPNYDAATCLQLLVSTAISGKLASGISTTPMT